MNQRRKITYLKRKTPCLITGNEERIYPMFTIAFLFVCFEIIAWLLQLLASLIMDDSGRNLKYLLFARLYMLLY